MNEQRVPAITEAVDTMLPVRLRRELTRLALKYCKKGAVLFIFGSFASGDQRQNSDLDLGVAWEDGRSDDVFRGLYEDVRELPTIRKIDLVDFSQASTEFRKNAFQNKIDL